MPSKTKKQAAAMKAAAAGKSKFRDADLRLASSRPDKAKGGRKK